MTGTTVVEREPEWDETCQEWAVGLLAYQSGSCGTCGTHYSHSSRTDVARDVQQTTVKCEDCAAIDIARDRYHKAERHTDERCDCDDQVFYVADYVPIPD